MKVEKMLRHYNPRNLRPVEIPVSMSVEFPESVTRPQQIVEGVRRIKETGWYRSLKRNGLHFTPVGSSGHVLFLAVGTAVSIGTGYKIYQTIKKRIPPEPK